MVQVAVIMSSQLARHSRWDVEFHMAVKRTADDVARLRERHTAIEAIDLLSRLDNAGMAPLKPLLRGGSSPRTPGREEYMRAIGEYPHIALALVRERAAQDVARHQREIDAHTMSIAHLATIMGDES